MSGICDSLMTKSLMDKHTYMAGEKRRTFHGYVDHSIH